MFARNFDVQWTGAKAADVDLVSCFTAEDASRAPRRTFEVFRW